MLHLLLRVHLVIPSRKCRLFLTACLLKMAGSHLNLAFFAITDFLLTLAAMARNLRISVFLARTYLPRYPTHVQFPARSRELASAAWSAQARDRFPPSGPSLSQRSPPSCPAGGCVYIRPPQRDVIMKRWSHLQPTVNLTFVLYEKLASTVRLV